MIHESTEEDDAGSPLLAPNECIVLTGEKSSLLLAHHPEIVDGDALLPQKVAPAVERNPRNVISAKGSGISPEIAHQTGTTG